jgi:predicted dehydrogenase
MFSRCSPANQHLHQVVAEHRCGPLRVLEIEGRSTVLWPGYDLGLDTLAMDMMHADFDLATRLLGEPNTVQVTGTATPRARVRPPRSFSATRTLLPGAAARR